jgi:endonuclease YncB( thermonuclease family)
VDILGAKYPADQPSKVWTDMGISLGKQSLISKAETLAKAEAMDTIIRSSGRVELGFIPGLATTVVTTEVFVQSAKDGDSLMIWPPLQVEGHTVNEVRLAYVDAPETHGYASQSTGFMQQYREVYADEAKNWLDARLKGKYVKLVYNKVTPIDKYGRLIAIVVDAKSAGRNYTEDNYLCSEYFDWLRDSVQGEILTSMELMRWYKPFIIMWGTSQPDSYDQIGDRTGTTSNLLTTQQEEMYADSDEAVVD